MSRHGLGRTRHIKVQYLWLQEKVQKNEVQVKKVDGKDNVADLFTKYLTSDNIDRLLNSMGMRLEAGRSDIGLKISTVNSSAISNLDRSFSEDATVDSWMNLKGNKSVCGTRHLISSQPFRPQIFNLTDTAVHNLRSELCHHVRWIRVHGIQRDRLFAPVGLMDGPSQRSHIPNFRVSFMEASDGNSHKVIIDQWKSKEFEIKDRFKGWTAFISYIPKALDGF